MDLGRRRSACGALLGYRTRLGPLGNRSPLDQRVYSISISYRGRGGSKDGQKVLLTLISLNVPAVALCNSGARKIAAKHDDHRNEIVFDAIVKDLLKTSQRVRLVQPNVRKEKKGHIREISFDSEGILSLQFLFCFGTGMSGEGRDIAIEHLRPPEASSPLYLESRRARISSLMIALFLVIPKEIAIMSHRAVSLLSQGGCPIAITLNVAFSV